MFEQCLLLAGKFDCQACFTDASHAGYGQQSAARVSQQLSQRCYLSPPSNYGGEWDG